MTRLDSNSMHRLAKMALDAGEVSTPEAAIELFSRYRLHIHLGAGWADTLAGQACFVTTLNTALRAFLGGVEVSGDISPTLHVPLFDGQQAGQVIAEMGARYLEGDESSLSPTLVLGQAATRTWPEFCVHLTWNAWGASVTPMRNAAGLACTEDNPLAGVAAAALGVNEAFLHIRGDLLEAGHRSIGISLWNPASMAEWSSEQSLGPALKYLPKSLWLVGLGHLGQAYAWTLGMLPYPAADRPHLVLQDFDQAAESNLSTCLLLTAADLGKRKVRVVAQRLEAAGFSTDLVERRFGPDHRLMSGEPTTALFGVDNLAARRDLTSAGFALVVEAGLGSGHRDFRNMRLHTFSGGRSPTEVWPADAAAQPAVELSDVYKRLAVERNDLCGMTMLASRAVATPFVGALAAALALAEVLRPLHGGGVHAVFDLQMKDLAYRSGALQAAYTGLQTPYVCSCFPATANQRRVLVDRPMEAMQ